MAIEQPGPFSIDFQRLWPIYLAQKNAGEANKKAEADYRAKSANWIAENAVSRDQNRALTPKPSIPVMQIVDDSGVASTGKFPWLVEPELPPVGNVVRNPTDQFFGGDPAKVAFDRTDQLILISKLLSDKLDQIITLLKR